MFRNVKLLLLNFKGKGERERKRSCHNFIGAYWRFNIKNWRSSLSLSQSCFKNHIDYERKFMNCLRTLTHMQNSRCVQNTVFHPKTVQIQYKENESEKKSKKEMRKRNLSFRVEFFVVFYLLFLFKHLQCNSLTGLAPKLTCRHYFQLKWIYTALTASKFD